MRENSLPSGGGSGVTRVVTPGAATEGVAPIFFPEKPAWRPFFSRQFCGVIAFYCFYSGVTPSRVSPTPFLPVRPRFFTILCCKFAHKILFPSGITLWRVSPGADPPGNATGKGAFRLAPALHRIFGMANKLYVSDSASSHAQYTPTAKLLCTPITHLVWPHQQDNQPERPRA